MLLITRRGWEIAEAGRHPRAARHRTPPGACRGRGRHDRGARAGACARARRATWCTRSNGPITAEADSTNYNNFYEFGTDKGIARAAQRLVTSPWTISLEGMVAKPRKIDLDDLLKQVQIEERLYRHRCVEGWAMTVPWTGFPLSALVKLAEPTASAKYVAFETLNDPKTMPGVRGSAFNWPYVEGVSMPEATNDLAFLVTGMYGKSLPKQDGAPIRLVLPWKYGFKSAKSIVKVTFTDQRPSTFWEALQPAEYGFWANVNPAVPHPALEPGDRAADRQRRAGADQTL